MPESFPSVGGIVCHNVAAGRCQQELRSAMADNYRCREGRSRGKVACPEILAGGSIDGEQPILLEGGGVKVQATARESWRRAEAAVADPAVSGLGDEVFPALAAIVAVSNQIAALEEHPQAGCIGHRCRSGFGHALMGFGGAC